MPDQPTAPWHALAVDEIVGRLAADPERGLTAAEAAARLARHGENRLREQPPEPRWWKLVRQFREVVVWILLVAAVIAAATGDYADAAVIVAIVLVNALIGFFQEERAQTALSALQRMAAPVATVVRDGVPVVVPAREIVPGDLLALAAGDAVAADARIVGAFALRVQEAALTGESAPVDKEAGVMPAATPLAERTATVHAGTVVAAGRATALVVATGMETELGRIAGLLGHTRAEQTPLQRRLAELGRWLIAVCLAVVGVILALELARGGRVTDVLLRAVSLAVAAVPEGLPAVVTVVLAIGLERLVARGTLVRRLPSVETLGSVTVICTDKTGTLTRDEMTVRAIETATARFAVTGSGYAPHGEFRERGADGAEGAAVPPATRPDLERLLLVGARCGNATVQPAGDGWRAIGDPTEAALVVAALKGGVSADPARPVVYELPFDSQRQRMSVVVRSDDGRRILETKGAPEAVLARCGAEWRDGMAVPLSDERRAEILAAAARLAAGALRVLALAFRELPGDLGLDGGAEGVERDLVHLGLVGMIDPPRDEARGAVATCRSAGIRPVMITGDHPATALAIGRELGLADAANRAVTGGEIAGLTDAALAAAVGEIAVYARVTAEDKLRIVRAWQQRGEVVAMTGDGVNDAPAIREADIGIAMGKSGTFVTREAADMVLTDDDFASIVGAVEEGRGIYDNIRKFIHYLLIPPRRSAGGPGRERPSPTGRRRRWGCRPGRRGGSRGPA
jgi:Ca2+-transporting ATPase